MRETDPFDIFDDKNPSISFIISIAD